MTSLFNLACFCSGVSYHEELSPPVPARGGAFAPRPVLNLRFFSFVGSTREDQSPSAGARVIHSSRLSGAVPSADLGICGPIEAVVEDVRSSSAAEGRLGPKSSSSLSESSCVAGRGGVGGVGSFDNSDGRLGPMTRERLEEGGDC